MHETDPGWNRSQPVPEELDAAPFDRPTRAVALARVRVPLTLTVAPWATLYRLPDGRRLWCLRLRDADGAVRTRCVAPDRLREYARRSRLPALLADLEAIDLRSGGPA